MKILYITTIGATMCFFESFINELINKGHSVDIACGAVDKIPEFYNDKRFHVFELSCSRSIFDIGNIKAINEIKSIVENNNYNIVHCHTPIAAACTRLACKSLRKKSDVKVVYTAHGFHFFKGGPLKNWLLYYPIEKWLSRYTDAIVTINHEDYHRALKKFYANNTYIIPGIGVDTQSFFENSKMRKSVRDNLGIADDDFLLISVGELNKRKNHSIVIKAITKISDSRVRYIICGEGPLKNKLSIQIEENGLNGRVKLLGYRSDIKELLSAADCFVFPSIREGLGLAAIEAMSEGVPLITSNAQGIKEYSKNGITGYVVNNNNDNEYKKAIIKMMNSKKNRELFQKNCINTSKKFDYAIVNKKIHRIYAKTLED